MHAMINAIVGHKGSGKTARIVKEITDAASRSDSNIVCIENGKRFDSIVPYTVRLIDIQEYPVSGFDELFAFIAGMNAKDYDISHIYIDSIYKVAKEENPEALAPFMGRLNGLAEKAHVNITLTISEEPDKLSDEVRSYIKY